MPETLVRCVCPATQAQLKISPYEMGTRATNHATRRHEAFVSYKFVLCRVVSWILFFLRPFVIISDLDCSIVKETSAMRALMHAT